MKKTFLSFLLIFFSIDSFAQDKEGYWGVAVGLRFQNVQDKLVTQMRYNGSPIYFMANHERLKNKRISLFQFEGSVGNLRTNEFILGKFPARFEQPQIKSYWNEITYSTLLLIKDSEKGQFWLGSSVSNLIHVRFSPRWDNSSINYDFTGNLQVELRYRRAFNLLGKEILGNVGLKLPLLGFMARPIYGGVPDFLDHEKSFERSIFENTSVSWLTNFPRVQFDNFVEFPISGGNKIQVLYNWEFYSFQNPNRVQASAHTIGINFLMRTK